MNRVYVSGNYFVGNNGAGRTTIIKSPVSIPGIWANYCDTGFLTFTKTWFLIDTTGKVFYLGTDDVNYGISGTNSTPFTSTIPVSIARPGSYSAVISSIGTNSAFIDGATGNIWTSGYGALGSLGNNTLTAVSSPVSIARPGSYRSIAVGGGAYTIFAIDATTGMVFGWGSNASGQIGDNTKSTRSSPVSIARNGSYSKVAPANGFTLFIDAATGNIWGTGAGTKGQLGNNTIGSVSSPVSIARPGSYRDIAGTAYSGTGFAIDASDGSLWAWGDNTFGLLGNNTLTPTSSPVSIARPGSYSSISATCYHAVAIDASDGSLWAWGANWHGQLGDGTSIPRSSPVSVLGNRSYISVKTGNSATVAMTADGTVYVWGYDGANQLGRQADVATNTIIPVQSNLSFSKVINNIFLDTAGNVYCTGSNGVGSLGNNSDVDSVSLVQIARPGSYSDIATTFFPGREMYSACAAIDGATGNIWTWGCNIPGAYFLGNNTDTISSSPVSIARPGSYRNLSGSYGNFMAIDATTGMVYVWGSNLSGSLGDNSTTARSSPVSIARPGSYSVVYAGADGSTLFIDAATGNIWGTGNNTYGQLGDNTKTTRSSPVSLRRVASYSKVTMSARSVYAIDASDGSLWAWGENTDGQLGDGTLIGKSSPVSVLGGRSYIDVVGLNNAATKATVFMLDATGTVWALGDNSWGQFGNGILTGSSSPVSLSLQSVKAINSAFGFCSSFNIDALSPVVDTQPSNATKIQGETAQFSVAAHGNPSL